MVANINMQFHGHDFISLHSDPIPEIKPTNLQRQHPGWLHQPLLPTNPAHLSAQTSLNQLIQTLPNQTVYRDMLQLTFFLFNKIITRQCFQLSICLHHKPFHKI